MEGDRTWPGSRAWIAHLSASNLAVAASISPEAPSIVSCTGEGRRRSEGGRAKGVEGGRWHLHAVHALDGDVHRDLDGLEGGGHIWNVIGHLLEHLWGKEEPSAVERDVEEGGGRGLWRGRCKRAMKEGCGEWL